MQNNVLKNTYTRVYLSKLLSCLEYLNELYARGDKETYLREIEVFYSDLLRFPQIYYKNDQRIQSNNELISSFSVIPGNPLNGFYFSHTGLLLKIERFIASRSAIELYMLSDDVRLFLDRLYDTVFPYKKNAKRVKYSILIAGVIVLGILSVILYSPLKARYLKEKEEYNLAVNGDAYKEKTLKDILVLGEALHKYYSDNNSYPKSSGGWDAVIAAYGESKEVWIPGLVPRYIKDLPGDPRKSKDPMTQYMYKSDGADFKLIAHFPIGMAEIIKNRPELVDTIRPSWAFGVWSKGAKNW